MTPIGDNIICNNCKSDKHHNVKFSVVCSKCKNVIYGLPRESEVRNKPCYCGSNKKYKKCCLNKNL